MLHVLSYDGDGGEVLLLRHLIHGSHLNLFPELFVEHLAGLVGVFVSHTDGSGVLGRCLADEEYADAFFCQGCEDASVDTDDSHHGKSGHSDETRVVDG